MGIFQESNDKVRILGLLVVSHSFGINMQFYESKVFHFKPYLYQNANLFRFHWKIFGNLWYL